jgi:hypothetical protein
VLSACADDEPEIKTGQWGGLGTELNVTSSGASVLLCCNSTGVIHYDGTVSGDAMRLRIISYPPSDPGGFVVNGPGGAEYRSLTFGVGFIEKEGTNPPIGCVCGPCVGCP